MMRQVWKIKPLTLWGAVITAVFVALASGDVWAAQGAAFPAEAGQSDLVAAWLGFLFSETAQGAASTGLSALAAALREALGVYAVSMMTIGGFFLIWQIVSMIAETAQTGVAMGQRANKLWTPFRFLIGIMLLIPLGGGLSLGQQMVVKIAKQGSSLASDAWQGAVDTVGVSLQTPLTPRLPDLAYVVKTSMEIELCRSLYAQAFTAYADDAVVARAGGMDELQKLPTTLLKGETWQYTNAYFADAPLCGAYAFLSPVGIDERTQNQNGQKERMLAEAARMATERLSLQNRTIAEKVAPLFLVAGDQSLPDVKSYLAAQVKEQSELVETKMAQIAKSKQQPDGSAARHGWISAGFYPFSIAQKQIALGEAAAYALPRVKPPLLGHSVLDLTGWVDAATQKPPFRGVASGYFDQYSLFYDRVSGGMKKARGWLYDNQDSAGAVLPNQQDVRDATGRYADAQDAQSVFSRVMTAGAVSFGVFASTGEGPSFSAALTSPLQAVAETGRRFLAFGGWALGMISPALSQPATIGTGIGLALVSSLFWLAGAVLLFLVPLVPCFRFLAAVIRWSLSVLGGIMLLPIVALGHLYPAGDGLVGPVARRAYWLWLSMFITPSLILLAFGGGLLLFLLGAVFLNVVFYEWLAPMAQPQSEAFWMLRGGLALAYAAFIYVLANVAFRGVSTFPALLSHWIDTRSLLPESVTINGGAGTHVSTAPAQSGGGAMGVIGDVWSRVTGQPSRPTAAPNAKAGVGGLAKTDQSPHFPHISEDRVAAARAEAKAKAQAFARAQSGETKAQAGAEAGAGAIAQSMSDLEIAMAKTIARQMPDLERGETKTPLTQKEETKEKPDEPPKESRPQNEEPLPDDKNPYKINPDTHE